MDLNSVTTIYFVGIKGVGMTALALIATDLNLKVQGSDIDEVFPTDKTLKKRKIKIKPGFASANISSSIDLVIYTGAHGGATNPEVIAAKKLNIPCLNLAQGLQLFIQNKKVLAVAGVGGKSTTSAMLSVVLNTIGHKPSYSVGVGSINNLPAPGFFNQKSPLMVVEADEFVADPQTDPTPRFHYLNPHIAIITNIEHDHPDVYPTFNDLIKAYQKFVSKVDPNGAIIINQDNPHNRQFIKSLDRSVITYGFSPQSDWQITKTHVADKKQFINIKANGIDWPQMILNAPGDYNALNALSVIIACNHLGISSPKIQSGLKAFTGTKRRFEHIDTFKGIDLYDDYAHHPIEINALLKAARSWLPNRRIIAIFQSHTYSRTKTLLKDFAASFKDADSVVINDIFSSAREKDNLGLTGQIFSGEVKKHHPSVNYCKGKAETINYLVDHITKGDVIFTIGAGDNWLWHKDIIKSLKNR